MEYCWSGAMAGAGAGTGAGTLHFVPKACKICKCIWINLIQFWSVDPLSELSLAIPTTPNGPGCKSSYRNWSATFEMLATLEPNFLACKKLLAPRQHFGGAGKFSASKKILKNVKNSKTKLVNYKPLKINCKKIFTQSPPLSHLEHPKLRVYFHSRK